MTIPSHHIRATYIEPPYYHSIVNRLIPIPSSIDMSITVVVTRVRVGMTWPVQRCASDSSGSPGFPWCCFAWSLFGPLRLSEICPGYWSSFPSSVTYSVERLVLHWAKRHIFRDSLAYLCVHCQLPCNVAYIQHLESCLCRVEVAPLRPLRSNELFRHHTHLHRGVGKTAIINIAIRGVGYHKHCHQGSR